MKIEQKRWTPFSGWEPGLPGELGKSAQVVFAFGNRHILEDKKITEQITNVYPNSYVLGCSTAGEIFGTDVTDDAMVITAIEFEHTQVFGDKLKVDNMQDSYKAGTVLAQLLNKPGLAHVFVLSKGININGTELVKGFNDKLPPNVSVTGGLSGDGDRFEKTFVMLNGPPEENIVAAIGFYGESLSVGFGSLGGWEPFGPERLITKSDGNILYEVDGQSALELYKRYLGEQAKDLPASALLFPLSLRTEEGEIGVVRTVLSIDEETQAMIFAGDVPEGSYSRLMYASFDRLIDGAAMAAERSIGMNPDKNPELAILVSCVGRKLILRQRTEEEVESVQQVMGAGTILTGFYSYGEISPFSSNVECELHNQTMTITTLSEV